MCFECGQKEHIRKKCPLNILQETEKTNDSSEDVVTHDEEMQEEGVKLEKGEREVREGLEEEYAEVSRRKKKRVKTPPKEKKIKEKRSKTITQRFMTDKQY